MAGERISRREMLKILLYGGSGLAVGALGMSTLAGIAANSGPKTGPPAPTSFHLKDLVGVRNVRDFGAHGDGQTDDSQAIQSAINDVDSSLGGTVYFPAGSYVCSGIEPKSNLSLVGEGPGRSILKGSSGTTGAIILKIASADSPTENISIAELELDGSAMERLPYTTGRKGIDMHYVTRGLFFNLYIHNTPATGLGTDFLVDTVIYACVCDSCGTDGAAPGSNGFGIGTGSRTSEPVIIANCISRNTRNQGYTYEAQPGTKSGSMVFLNCLSFADKVGFNVDGAGPVTISNCGAFDSNAYGIRVKNYAHQVPKDILISNCQVIGSGGEGIAVINSEIQNLTIANCRIDGALGNGISVSTGYSMVTGNIVSNCGGNGIDFEAPDGITLSRLSVSNNIVHNNGRNSIEGSDSGISLKTLIDSAIDHASIHGNQCFDDGNPKTQRFGIALTGSLSNVVVENNLVLDNLSAGIRDMISNSNGNSIRFNTGYNPVGLSAVSVGPSPFRYRAGKSPETLYIRQGNISKITKSGIDLFTTGPATIQLEPNEDVSITFSSAPVIVKDVH